MSSTGGLLAALAGPATSPGQLLHGRRQHQAPRQSLGAHFHPSSSPSSSTSGKLHRTLSLNEHGAEEELVWWDNRVVWSKGAEVVRQWTFEGRADGDVHWAGFVWFPPQGQTSSSRSARTAGDTSSSRGIYPGEKKDNGTFGPFHSSQHCTWGAPAPSNPPSSSSSPFLPVLVRTLLVCLSTRGEVFYPSGEHSTFHLPFPVHTAFPLPRTDEGGVLLQRRLETREIRRLNGSRPGRSMLRGMEVGMVSVLDEIVDLEDSEDSLPRLYTLGNPFEELKMVVEATVLDGKCVGPEEPLVPTMTVLFVSVDPYPFVVAFDSETREVVFYRREKVAVNNSEPIPAPLTVRTMRPSELLAQPVPPPVPPPARGTAPRPSVQRTQSTFSTTDRRMSGITNIMTTETLDRTRRGPRVSRGGVVDSQPPVTGTGELQAALDPPALPHAARARKGKARSSILATDLTDRRQSGGSSFMREEPERPVLFGAAERDIRETTMMMGLEKEEGTRSEWVLERIWVWKPPEGVNVVSARCFISENLSSEHVHINIHLSSTLYTFLAEHTTSWNITPFHFIPCTSAIPILSTRHAVSDTLVLHEGEIQLVTSSNLSIPVSLPKRTDGRDELPGNFASSLSMIIDGDESMGSARSTRRIIGLCDGVGSRCTVAFEEGEAVRMSVDHRIRDDLVRKAMEAISWLLPAEAFFVLKRDLAIAEQTILTSQRRERTVPWDVFVTVLKGLFGLPAPPSHPSSDLLDQALRSADPITRRLAAKCRAQSASHGQKAISTPSEPSKEFGGTGCAAVLIALHLVGQDCRLSSSRSAELQMVARLVVDLSSALGRDDWRDYWMRLIPLDGISIVPVLSLDSSILDVFESPPDIFAYLLRRLHTPLKPFPSPHSILPYHTPEYGLTRPCARTTMVISIYDRFATPSTPVSDARARADSLIQRASSMVNLMAESGLKKEWLANLPPAVAVPILEMLRLCQVYPQKGWSASTYDFVGRSDYAATIRGGTSSERDDNGVIDEGVPTVGAIMASVTGDKSTNTRLLPSLSHVRFGSDRRLAEVERIMQTTQIRTISLHDPNNASDADIAQYHRSTVNLISTRTLSIPIGQGIFEYGTRTAKITDVFEVPNIELRVKIVPAKTTMLAEYNPETAEWPRFHNGVATALSISPDCKGIDSSWIVFNRPITLNPEHGGFLLGLGLTGHLRSLVTYHAFPYMEPRHDFTSVGLLLGLACSFAGSEDLLITKILSLHTHALLPLGSMDLNASPIIQSTSLVGLGLVYAGSKSLRMAEVALAEVGRKEMSGVDGFVEYQESYSFSAAMAFGLIMLGQGGQVTSEVDRRMLAKLTRCIVGSAPSLELSGSGPKSSIDTTITSPGATLALGLMYLKTNRRDIADILEIPQSAFALEHIRPDLLLLRVFVRGLIMWDDIAPSLAWIEAQLPTFINHKGHKRTSQMELNVELAYINIVAGACLAIGIKYAGTATEMAHNNLAFFYSVLAKAAGSQSMTYEGKIRRNAARQGLNVVTIASCVVMSGTGELHVLRKLRLAHGQEGAGVTYGTHMAMHMALGILFLGRGNYTLGSSNLAIAAMAIAFFPRFLSGMGDNKAYPQAFRHLWALAVEPRCLVAKDVQTGETIYLPVKVKLQESGQIRTQSLISPTLIAPFESILSISVDSPRYWPITYDLSDPHDRETLVRSRTIYVQRKAGYLDYNSDPKGNRSMFIRAGTMSTFDLHYDLISPARPPAISAAEVQELMRVHSRDPALIAMADMFSGDTDLDRAMRIVLLECVSLDKPNLVPVYMALLLPPAITTEAVRGLGFLKMWFGLWEREYMVPQTKGERQPALVRPNTVNSLYRRMAAAEPSEGAKRAYLLTGEWTEREKMAIWLTRDHVPPVRLLVLLRERVGNGVVSEVMKLRLRESTKAYAEVAAGQYDLNPGTGGLDIGLWKGRAVDEAVRVWSG